MRWFTRLYRFFFPGPDPLLTRVHVVHEEDRISIPLCRRIHPQMVYDLYDAPIRHLTPPPRPATLDFYFRYHFARDYPLKEQQERVNWVREGF